MGLTLSHLSALDVTRKLRSAGRDLKEMDSIPLRRPAPWVGKRWGRREFDQSFWEWPPPSQRRPLHVLVPREEGRVRAANVHCHTQWNELPHRSVLWLDERSSMVCPELLFLQVAETFSMPMLVLLGYELCGCFSRSAEDPLEGDVTIHVPPATTVGRIRTFLDGCESTRGLARAKQALCYVSNFALSDPEAVLATMYSLPAEESGYGMGPIVLNKRVDDESEDTERAGKTRFPDLLFSFAPLGINYDGEGHLDLKSIVKAARNAERLEGEAHLASLNELEATIQAVRKKVVDDNVRNRQLAARGYLVIPATKEDLYGEGNLDRFTRDLLSCARNILGVDTQEFERTLEDTNKMRDRNELLRSMLPAGRIWGSSRGKL